MTRNIFHLTLRNELELLVEGIFSFFNEEALRVEKNWEEKNVGKEKSM